MTDDLLETLDVIAAHPDETYDHWAQDTAEKAAARIRKLEGRNNTLRNLYNDQSTHIEELAKKLQAAEAKVAALQEAIAHAILRLAHPESAALSDLLDMKIDVEAILRAALAATTSSEMTEASDNDSDEMDTLAERVVDWHRENATGINGLSFSEIDLAHLYAYTIATLRALAQMDIPIAPPGSVVVPEDEFNELTDKARRYDRSKIGEIPHNMIAAAGGNND